MDILSGIILGAVQGITEFLPISSTGHLIIAREVLGLQVEYGLSVDAVLHLATALAVLIYFRHDFISLVQSAWSWMRRGTVEKTQKYLILALVLGTIPAAVLGILFESYLDTAFRSVELVAWTLIAGSVVFFVAEIAGKRNVEREVTPRMGWRIGFFQAIALIPGMSRSGMAISGGLILGLTREQAARFAFLLSFPIILGAGGVSAFKLGGASLYADLGVSLIASALTAFVVGMLAIHYLLKYLKNHTLGIFIIYRLLLAVVVLALL